jgi:hypothetical protein
MEKSEQKIKTIGETDNMSRKRKISDFNELEYKGKLYIYIYEELRDDSDNFDGESGYNVDEDYKMFNLEIYDEHEKLLKETEVEADSIIEVQDEDVIDVIKKYKL